MWHSSLTLSIPCCTRNSRCRFVIIGSGRQIILWGKFLFYSFDGWLREHFVKWSIVKEFCQYLYGSQHLIPDAGYIASMNFLFRVIEQLANSHITWWFDAIFDLEMTEVTTLQILGMFLAVIRCTVTFLSSNWYFVRHNEIYFLDESVMAQRSFSISHGF